jgi:hypothetical protein
MVLNLKKYNFLYILIDTLFNEERYLNIENKTLAPFLDNSVNEEFNFPEASIILLMFSLKYSH